MHYLAIVITAPGETIAHVMEPHRDNYDEETETSTGFWDWFQFGGRWDKLECPRSLAAYREMFDKGELHPYTMLSSNSAIHVEEWVSPNFVKTLDVEDKMRALMGAAHPDSTVHVVDYHL